MKELITQILKAGSTVTLSIDGFTIEKYKDKYNVWQESCGPCSGTMVYESEEQAIEAFLLAKDL
jgi:hypothetical protein